MNYKLNDDEIAKISSAIIRAQDFKNDPILNRFVKLYESRPDFYTSQSDRIRYLASKRNLTLNSLETLLGLPGGSISNSSATTNHRVDAFLSAFFNVPISDFRSLKRYRTAPKKQRTDPAKVVKLLRALADEIEKGN